MQPQSPYGPSQPYNPQDPQGQGQAYPPTPGQNQGQPQQYPTGQPYGQQFGPQQQPQQPQQPPMPVYMPPQATRNGPQQPENLPPPPPAATTPYDFFMDQPKQRVSSNPLSPNGKQFGTAALQGSSMRSKILMSVIGTITVIAIIAVIFALLPKDKTGPQWFAIAQRQQEVIRICTLGSKAKYQSTRNFAITCQTGVTNNQRQVLAYMNKLDMSYNSKELGLLTNTKVDTRLKSASLSSTYDDVFREIAEQQLTTYNAALSAQLAATAGINGRDTLAKSQTTAKLLLQLAGDGSDKTEATASDDGSSAGE